MTTLWNIRNLRLLAESMASTLEVRILTMRLGLFCAKEEKAVVQRDDVLLAVLMRWEPGERTDFHSHGDSIGVLRVLVGKMHEETWNGERVETQTLNASDSSDFAAGDIHRLTCTSAGRTVTLHLYANAPRGLQKMTRYATDAADALLLIKGHPTAIDTTTVL